MPWQKIAASLTNSLRAGRQPSVSEKTTMIKLIIKEAITHCQDIELCHVREIGRGNALLLRTLLQILNFSHMLLVSTCHCRQHILSIFREDCVCRCLLAESHMMLASHEPLKHLLHQCMT